MRDVFFIVCDRLKGMPDSVDALFPQAIVQTCIIHLIRSTFRYASKRHWDHIAGDRRPIYTAPWAQAAWSAFEEFEEEWATPYPAVSRLWRDAWEQNIGVPGLRRRDPAGALLDQCHRVLNARYRRAVNAKGHFPTEQAALKTLYLVTRSLDPKGTGQGRWVTRWKPALNAFAVTFADRMPAAENL